MRERILIIATVAVVGLLTSTMTMAAENVEARKWKESPDQIKENFKEEQPIKAYDCQRNGWIKRNEIPDNAVYLLLNEDDIQSTAGKSLKELREKLEALDE